MHPADSPIVYLDNNATTRVEAAVREAMEPFLDEAYANPSSPYQLARRVSSAVATAREQVAALLGAEPSEVVFTGGGTESNNTALQAAIKLRPGRRRIVTTAVEHASVRSYCKYLERSGYEVIYLGVDPSGQLDVDALRQALEEPTALVTIMTANNETGVLFDLNEVAACLEGHDALFHTDAVQAAGKIPLSPVTERVDLLSVSGHKLHATKGIGAMYVRSGLDLPPYLLGGDQERGRRAGTENVPGIVALGAASALALGHLDSAPCRMRALRDRFEQGVTAQLDGVSVAGQASPRLANTTLLVLDKIESEAVLALLDMEGICCSSGSACTTGSSEPSHVLQAMGLTRAASRAAIRISLSRFTTEEEVAAAADAMVRVVKRLQRGV